MAHPMPDSLLTLDQVTMRAGTQSFGPFSLALAPGEHIAILGPSGAGKSTLLKVLSKELLPASGDMTFMGKSIRQWPLTDLSKVRAVLPQSHEVAFGLQTELIIGLGRVMRMHDPRRQHIIEASASLACCSHLLGRRFDTLSGGEKARVQLARVFAQLWDVHNGLFLVDEPIAALDPGLQFDLMDAISTFADERHHAVIAVLHDINHALAHFTRLLLVKDGQLAGDCHTSQEVIPALEQLYDISLDTIRASDGALVVRPVRRQAASHRATA